MELKQDKLKKLSQDKLNDLITNQDNNYKIIEVFRTHFDTFEAIISNNSTNKKASEIISDLLFESGYTKKDGGRISSNYVLRTLSDVRKEKGKVKNLRIKHKAVSPSSAFKQRVPSLRPINTDVKVNRQMTNPPVKSREQNNVAIGVEKLPDTVSRLTRESKQGGTQWNEKDEYFLMSVLYEAYLQQKDGIFLDGFWETMDSREFEWSSQALKNGYRLIKNKLESLNMMGEYEDLK